MPRFFVAATNIFGGVAYMDGKDAEHLRVLRVRRGELLTVCDGRGTDYICRVTKVENGSAEAAIIEAAPSAGEPDVACAVYAALPKGDKAEHIIQKAVELGASELVFFQSERCVSRPDGASMIKKLERWNKIAEEASKQSGRGLIPPVGFAPSFGEMLRGAAKAELGLFLWEEERETSLKSVLEAAGGFKSAAVVTGPEGGFERHEAERAAEAGMKLATLGPRILRCDTAPLCALSALMFYTNNLSY
jgi:16S rRNA (uracil1498-N3)-methyltransferase